MKAKIVQPQSGKQVADPPPTLLVAKLVGATVSNRDESNGYLFWGLVALFIGVPELLAAFSKTLKADIPWPTVSNLVGKDLDEYSLDTVQMFRRDAVAAGYQIAPVRPAFTAAR